MKKIILLGICVLGVISCSKKESFNDKVLKAITPYVETQTELDFKKKENVLSVISVDTLTEKDRIEIKVRVLYDYLKEEHSPLLEIQKDEVEAISEVYKKYGTANAKHALDASIKEYERLKNNALPYMEEMQVLKEKHQVADSVKFKAYKVTALLNFVTKDNIAKVDTLMIIMNDQFNVIERKDFAKN